jgi:CheY-like chemotaxis protein
VMDGLQATAAIRGLERMTGSHIPILALTAHAMAGDRQHLLASGMDGYVSKPIRSEELLETIEHLTSRPMAPACNPRANQTDLALRSEDWESELCT